MFESRDTEKDRILLSDIPGGAEAFETAARFLYGGKVELTSANVATIRCAAEYLEMTESLGEGNLIAKAEHFLNSVVLGSWRDSITVLKSCSELRPWAEELEIVRRCSESVAWKASTDPHGIRWSFSATGSGKDAPRDWWFEDVATLYIDTFSKVINAVTVKGMRPSMVTAAVAYYAEKWLHLTKESDASTTIKTHVKEETQASFMAFTGFNQGIVAKDAKKTQHKNRAILQGIVSLLPPESESIEVKFLVKLLKVACVVNAGPLCKTDLAKRVGVQLDKVSMDDLLIPASGDSTYDIDVVQQIVEFYLQVIKTKELVESITYILSRNFEIIPQIISQLCGVNQALGICSGRYCCQWPMACHHLAISAHCTFASQFILVLQYFLLLSGLVCYL